MIVEVDPETMMSEIKRYVVAHDCGTVINPMIVVGQIQGRAGELAFQMTSSLGAVLLPEPSTP